MKKVTHKSGQGGFTLTPKFGVTLRNKGGFTLVELLVVIAIIGLLAGVVMLAMNNARAEARLARTQADLKQLQTAISELVNDTGRWPNGCPPNQVSNPEVFLDQPRAGIKEKPPVGVVASPCEWTQEEVDGWRGPYTLTTLDLWGRSYRFDSDYITHCESGSPVREPVIHSVGQDGQWEYPYSDSCNAQNTDDIFTLLQ